MVIKPEKINEDVIFGFQLWKTFTKLSTRWYPNNFGKTFLKEEDSQNLTIATDNAQWTFWGKRGGGWTTGRYTFDCRVSNVNYRENIGKSVNSNIQQFSLNPWLQLNHRVRICRSPFSFKRRSPNFRVSPQQNVNLFNQEDRLKKIYVTDKHETMKLEASSFY